MFSFHFCHHSPAHHTHTHTHSDMVGSGSPGPVEVRLHCDEGGLKNPMDWGTVPTALQEKFPHWKKTVSDDKQSSQVSLGRGEWVNNKGGYCTL